MSGGPLLRAKAAQVLSGELVHGKRPEQLAIGVDRSLALNVMHEGIENFIAGRQQVLGQRLDVVKLRSILVVVVGCLAEAHARRPAGQLRGTRDQIRQRRPDAPLHLVERLVLGIHPNTPDTRPVLRYLALHVVELQVQAQDRVRHQLGRSGQEEQS